MKNFNVKGMVKFAVLVQADNEEEAISEAVNLVEWPGFLLDEKYEAEMIRVDSLANQ